jgi:AcrR family transcriptional regulator
MTDWSVIFKSVSRIAAAHRQQHAADRREQILVAALGVFSDNGFAETKMDKVAARAGVAKGSLYLYFPSKQALLEALVTRYTLLPELPELVDSLRDCPPALAIPTLVTEMWKRLRSRAELARVVVREIQSHPARGKLYSEQIGMRAGRVLAEYLELWMKRGEIRRMDALAAAQSLFGMLWYFLLTQELMGGREIHPLSDGQVTGTIARIFLDGAGKRRREPPSGKR